MSEKNYSVIRDIRKIKWAVIAIIAYFLLSGRFFGSVCPVVIFTGYPCPACGLTRAGLFLLSLQFQKAWEMNPFIYPIIGWFLAAGVYRYLLGKKIPKWLKYAAIVLILGMVCFYLYRMRTDFPNVPPMTYTPENFLSLLRSLLISL